jgi:hypothetical protein
MEVRQSGLEISSSPLFTGQKYISVPSHLGKCMVSKDNANSSAPITH